MMACRQDFSCAVAAPGSATVAAAKVQQMRNRAVFVITILAFPGSFFRTASILSAICELRR
jgi:hypothetical protein